MVGSLEQLDVLTIDFRDLSRDAHGILRMPPGPDHGPDVGAGQRLEDHLNDLIAQGWELDLIGEGRILLTRRG